MRHLLPKMFLTLLGFSVLAGVAAKEQIDGELETLQRQWAEAQRHPQSAELGLLAAHIDRLAEDYPESREAAALEREVDHSHGAAAARPAKLP